MYIDTHCHLNNEDYVNLEEVITHMGNNIMISSGASKKDNANTIELINKYNNIYGVVGFHPDEADCLNENYIEDLENLLKNSKVVGIGEIGLDYYHDGDKKLQKELFIEQLELAKKYNLPVTIHSRDAALDTLEILKNYKELKKVLHCYSYSLEMAREFIKIGCKFGIGGVLTFKNSKVLKEVVENIDLKYLLLETDSPYLAPEPLRGTVNEPYNITYVAKEIARLKNTDVEKVYEITTKNACEIYNIKL